MRMYSDPNDLFIDVFYLALSQLEMERFSVVGVKGVVSILSLVT